MKKANIYLIATLFLLTFAPMRLIAATEPLSTTTVETKRIESTEIDALLIRLNEIKTMDKSSLSSAEKKALRKEVRAAKSRMKELGGGVYLSAGAIIIIILLLILIL